MLLERPPFRAPHHQATIISLVGGGSASPRPGEASLATHGVLFLDELGEFPVAALESLRQPLEEGVIRVNRAGGKCGVSRLIPARGRHEPLSLRRRGLRGGVLVFGGHAGSLSTTHFCSVPRPVRPGRAGNPTDGRANCCPAPQASRRRTWRLEWRLPEDGPMPGVTKEPVLTAGATDILFQKLGEGALSARGLRKVTGVAQTIADLAGGRDRQRQSRLRGTLSSSRTIGGRGMSEQLPDEAYAIALALQPEVGPATLREC